MCVCVCVCVGVCLWRSLCQNALMLKDTASILMHILGLPFKQYPSFSLILNTKQKREPKWKHITYENMCQQGNSYFRWNINETTYRNISYSKEKQHGKICTQKALNKQWMKPLLILILILVTWKNIYIRKRISSIRIFKTKYKVLFSVRKNRIRIREPLSKSYYKSME